MRSKTDLSLSNMNESLPPVTVRVHKKSCDTISQQPRYKKHASEIPSKTEI